MSQQSEHNKQLIGLFETLDKRRHDLKKDDNKIDDAMMALILVNEFERVWGSFGYARDADIQSRLRKAWKDEAEIFMAVTKSKAA